MTTLLLGSLAIATACGSDKSRSSTSIEPATPVPPVEGACADGIDNDKDGKLDCDDPDCIAPGGECVPAPPLDRTVATTVTESAAYLYQGDNPLQKDADPRVFDKQRIAMLRGRTVDAKGAPLSAVRISVKGHPEFGYTYTRGDGAFDMAVNGGARLVLDYERAGYLALQRAVQPGWQRYLVVPDAGLVAVATQVSQLTSNSAEPQTIVGERIEDEYGARQPLVVFDPNTTATVQLPDGNIEQLPTLTVTATEYPIDSNNTYAPGSISLSGGLSYGLEFGVKEAAARGAEHVAFDKPVSLYVEDIAYMAVGKRLVVQQYDRTSGQWEPALRGRVIQILEMSNGHVTIDSDGDGVADDAATLEQQGLTASDQSELATRYDAGQILWHAEISHFSGLHLQAQGTPPATALPPLRRGIITKTIDTPTYRNGMVVEYQASTHSEPISGTPFSLHYQSNRTLSYGAGRQLEVPLLGDSIPSGLKKIRSRVTISGRSYEKEFTKLDSNLRHSVTWDGTDAQGRLPQGEQVAEVTIAYVYADASGSKAEAILPVSFNVTLSNWDARAFGLGGFSIDAHHAFDPAQQIIYFGNGTQRSGNNVALAAQPANADATFNLGTPDSLVVAADGSLIFTDDQTGTQNFGRIIKLGLDGMPSILFGDGAIGAAADVLLTQPQGILVTSDGRLIVADIFEQRIVEIAPDGTLRTLVSGLAEDNPVVLQALNRPDGMALGPREELYFVDADKVYRFEAGKLEVIAGGGSVTTDGGNATNALLVVPSGLAVDKDGNIFLSERGKAGQPGGHRVRKISPTGVITSVAGTGTPGFSGDGDIAATAQLNDPHGLALDPEGRLYIVDQGNGRIRRIDSDGMIQTVIGGGTEPLNDNSMAINVKLDAPDGIAACPDGSLYIAQKNSVIRAFVGMPQLSRNDHLVPSTDGRQLYRFDPRGRHLATVDAMTGVTELSFKYDANGMLLAITDKDANTTTIERDVNGVAQAVVGPYGQRTSFKLDSNTVDSSLATITDPLGRTTSITWDANKLVGKIESPKKKASIYAYDPSGRLLHVSDPTGYNETLKRSELTNGWQVDVTNSASQTTRYSAQYQGEVWTRTTIAADNSKTIFIDTGASVSRQGSDGTKQQVSFLAHELFGAQVLRPYVDSLTLPSGKSLTTTYTPAMHFKATGNPLDLISQTDAAETNGRWFESVFTKATGNLVETSPAGRTAQITLDSLGHAVSFTAAGMPTTAWQYDRGRVNAMTRSANNQTRTNSVGYDANGWVRLFTNALNQDTAYGRDVMGRLTTLQRPDGKKTIWDLDDADNVTSITPPNNQAHLFSYYTKSKLLEDATPPAVATASGAMHFEYDDLSDSLSQLKKLTRADGRSIGFEYDVLGRLSAQKLGNATLNFYYTAGHLTRINRSDGVTVDQTFDGPLWTGSKWSGGISGNVKATYDENFWLSSLTVNDASTVSFAYDNDGLLTSATATVGGVALTRDAAAGYVTGITLGNTSSQQSFTNFGELAHLATAVSGAALFEQSIVERDALGRIRHLTEAVQGVAHDIYYEYDLAGRLAKQTRDGTNTIYSYDSNGNRTGVQTGSAAATSATYDAQDRILTSGAQKYEHDAHGDLKSRSDGTMSITLAYDELGNLMKVVVDDSGTKRNIEYAVDGLGRRVARRVNGQFDKAWLYRDALRPIAEIAADGSFTHFVYASNDPLGGAPVAMIRAGVFYRVVTDHIGSVRLVINAQTGAVAQSIDYDAYGRVLNETGAGFQPIGFAGGLYDADTKLVRFGARDYDAETGRWTNKDPIGFAGQQGNQYVYVDGEPVNRRDPSGRWGFALGVGGDLGYCFGWCVGSWGVAGGLYIDHRSGFGVFATGQGGMGLGAHAGLSLQISGFNSLNAFQGTGYGGELITPGPSGTLTANSSGGVLSGAVSLGGGLYAGPVVSQTSTMGISWQDASDAWSFAVRDASVWWTELNVAVMRELSRYVPTSFNW